MLTQSLTNAALTIGFVAGLSSIGLATMSELRVPFTAPDVVSGAAQSLYGDHFADPYLKPVAVPVLAAARYALFAQASRGALVGHNGWLFTDEEFVVHPDFDANIAASVAQVADVQKHLASVGTRLLPVLVPDKAEIYANEVRVERPDAIKSRRSNFRDALAGLGISALDAAPVLAQGKNTTDTFMKDDTHWSPNGARLVAERIAQRVQDLALDIASATVNVTQDAPRPFDGDLLNFVPTGALRSWVGPAQATITPYTTSVETQGGLFGDAPVDVALVGTSFSARDDFNFVGFLQHAMSSDVLRHAEMGQGPFAPMTAYLASDAFQSNPPKLVIWEIPVRYVSMEISK